MESRGDFIQLLYSRGAWIGLWPVHGRGVYILASYNITHDFQAPQFGAHAALPSLARDMAEPHRFGEAMNYAFVSDAPYRLGIVPD